MRFFETGKYFFFKLMAGVYPSGLDLEDVYRMIAAEFSDEIQFVEHWQANIRAWRKRLVDEGLQEPPHGKHLKSTPYQLTRLGFAVSQQNPQSWSAIFRVARQLRKKEFSPAVVGSQVPIEASKQLIPTTESREVPNVSVSTPSISIVTRPAAEIKQGGLRLFTTSLRVRDLLIPNFYSISHLDPEENDKGYQRLLNVGRAKKLANYLLDGQKEKDAFLPTSIFLATDKTIAINPENNTITFDVSDVCPFSVVDGQHRIEGLKMAAEKNPELLDFEVPVNIAVGLDEISQMCHFLIVNTTQKSVDAGVEQRIYARLTALCEFKDIPTLPKWIRRIVEKGDDEQALRIVDFLNGNPESPWHKKIEIANQDDSGNKTSINQKSFVKSLKKFVLIANNPLSALESEKQQKLLLNYWTAISNILGNSEMNKPTVLYKYVGVEIFHKFSTPVFLQLAQKKDFRVAAIESLLRDTFENVGGDYSGISHPSWWLSGTGPAGKMNALAQGHLVAALTKALHDSQLSAEAEF